MSGHECIHGLDLDACDVCSPRRVETVPPPRASRAPRPRPLSEPPSRPTQGVRVRTTVARRYLVVHRDRLAELLAEPLGDDAGWRTELGDAGAADPIRWEDAGLADKPADLVVLVGSGEDPDRLELVAVLNQPAKAVVSEILRESGRTPRLVLHPAWFA